MQCIGISILITTMTMIMHILMTTSMTMIIMITTTSIMTTITITAREKRERAVLLLTCSKIRLETQMVKHLITFISSSDLCPILRELSKKRLILTNSLSKKSWPILRPSRQ